MLNYSDLYEYLRKEKYGDQLQHLPKNFISEFSEYLTQKKKEISQDNENMLNSNNIEKKQFENAITLFKELMLRRKRKLLNLVFIAAETGIMKRDYTEMLQFEKEVFEDLVSAVERGDKQLDSLLNGNSNAQESELKMIIIQNDIEEFMGMSGNTIGPYKKGSLVNLDRQTAEILVSGNKARYVDEE